MDNLLSHLSGLYTMLLNMLDNLGVDIDRVAELLAYDSRQPLLFNTGLFLVLFGIFMLIYRMLRPWRVARMIFTILFSLYF